MKLLQDPDWNSASSKPLFTLQHDVMNESGTKGNGVASICAFSTNTFDHANDTPSKLEFENTQSVKDTKDFDSDSDSDSDDDEDISSQLKSSHIGKKLGLDNQVLHSTTLDALSTLSLDDKFLASTSTNGNAFVWNLKTRKVASLDDGESGRGIACGRMHSSSNSILFHQRRNEMGTISLFDQNLNVVGKIHCYSQTFCQASACCNEQNNLIASPSKIEATVQLWDVRARSSIGIFNATSSKEIDSRREGMLMSLKLMDWKQSRDLYVACGMESGKVFFHDLRMLSSDGSKQLSIGNNDEEEEIIETESCHVRLGKDPVLALDMHQSYKPLEDVDSLDSHRKKKSFVAICGVAADASEVLSKEEEERGTISIAKFSCTTQECQDQIWGGRVRAKVGTCSINADINYEGKPGVGACKFSPDYSLFAVGGWDKRCRIFTRKSAKLLDIMKGPNTESIVSLEWIECRTGNLLAAGSSDGKICIYRPSILKKR